MWVVDVAVPVDAYQLVLSAFETAQGLILGFTGFQIQAFGLFFFVVRQKRTVAAVSAPAGFVAAFCHILCVSKHFFQAGNLFDQGSQCHGADEIHGNKGAENITGYVITIQSPLHDRGGA